MRVVLVGRAYADPSQRGKLRALAGLGCTVAAAVPASWRPHPDERRRQAAFGDDGGVRIYPVAVRRDRWDSRALARIITEFRPDLVQIEEEPWTRVAAALARGARRHGYRVVLYSADSLPPPLPLVARLRRARTVRRAAAVVGASRQAAALLAAGRRALMQVVVPATGVAPPLAVRREPAPGLTIGFVGRLVPEKGLDVLFRACVRLRGAWAVHVVGTGSSQEELEELAARLGIAARVTWHGALPRESLEPLWAELDCLALPSRTTPQWVETRGRTALEAMAHAVPVVGSRSGVLPELLEGVGLVVPEDDVPALAAALQALLDDPAERLRLGAESRRRVLADYTDEAVARRTLALWRKALAATA
ncbi:MAG TPA: glycosyltransferase [Gemmatimonadales bacterium]|nr:glycosyltransferase [Gemmatimonadales bacterium]